MASESELSEQVIGVELVETLLNKFKGEMLDCLLFVNHVKTIAIHQVSFDICSQLEGYDKGVKVLL